MNLQEKLFETSAELRSRAQAFAATAVEKADAAAKQVEQRLGGLRGSLAVLNSAGRKFNKVARRHATSFVKQNSTLVAQVRDDVSELARSTFTTLTAPASKPRKARTTAKRVRKAVRKSN